MLSTGASKFGVGFEANLNLEAIFEILATPGLGALEQQCIDQFGCEMDPHDDFSAWAHRQSESLDWPGGGRVDDHAGETLQ
jgi:hypothetical protein